jgi:glycosyltransferase involved in cell wall biosynthesis
VSLINLYDTILLIAVLAPALLILLVALWNVLAWPKIKPARHTRERAVSVLIPARDEESNIAACLDSVLKQGETVLEILVYDDHSADATPRIIRQYRGRDARVRLVTPSELPQGWCGKNFACAQLAKEASGEWLLFLDADARLAGMAVASLVEEAIERDLTLLSGWPALGHESFWERALMPMLNFVVFTLFPAPLSLVRGDESLGLVHGACILVDSSSYYAIGGHAAVRDEIFEDQRLAHLWRAKGMRGLCLDGQDVVSVRMYNSFGEIWGGFQKNFFPAFHHEASFWVFILLHLLVFLAPMVALPFLRAWPLMLAAACVIATRALLALRFRHPLWSVLLHPAAEVILIAVGLSSWWRLKSGRGVVWKGRQYHAAVK